MADRPLSDGSDALPPAAPAAQDQKIAAPSAVPWSGSILSLGFGILAVIPVLVMIAIPMEIAQGAFREKALHVCSTAQLFLALIAIQVASTWRQRARARPAPIPAPVQIGFFLGITGLLCAIITTISLYLLA